MEGLPSNLLYLVNQVANYSKNNVKIQTLNQTSLASNGSSQLRLALPVNAIINMKSLSMHCDFSTTGVGDSTGSANDRVYALIPRNGIASCLDRVTWSMGGISCDNGVTPYHLVYNMLRNLKCGSDKYMSDDKVLNQSVIESINGGGAYETANSGQSKHLVLNNFLGLTEMHPCYFDLSLVPECFLTVQCTDNSVLPVQFQGTTLGTATPLVANPNFSGTQCNFAMNNIFFTADVVSIGNGLYDALTQRLLAERGSLDVPYHQYQLFSQSQSDAGGSIRGSVSTMSLNKVFAFQRNADTVANGAPYAPYFTQQAPVLADGSTTYAYTQASDNFISKGIKDWQFTINNSPYPLYKPTPIEAYNFVVIGEDRTYSKHSGSLVGSQAMWLDNAWCAPIQLNHDDEITRVTGMNLMSINSQIAFQTTTDGVSANNWARQVFLMTEQTSLIRIGEGRAVAVVA